MPKLTRGHVEQQHVLDVALQDAALDRGADRHDFVRVDAAVRLTAEELLHDFHDLGHAGHAADQDHFVDLARLQAGILERRLAGLDRALDQIVHQGFQLGAGQLDVQVLRTGLVGGDERQVHFRLHAGRQLDLGLLGGFLQALKRQTVAAQVDALLLAELVGEIIDDLGVEVLATQEGVAVGRLHLEHAVADLKHRHVEGAAAEVVDRDGAGALLFHAVSEGGGRRLVDDAEHFEARDLAGVLGRLALAVVEVRRDRDDGLGDLLAQIVLGGFLHLLKDEGADLAGAVLLAVALDPRVAVVAADDLVGDEALVLLGQRIVVAAADQALDREQGVVGIGHSLTLRRLTDQPLTALGESDHRRSGTRAFGVLDDLGTAAFHHGHARVRGAQVDTNHFAHHSASLLRQTSSGPVLRHRHGPLWSKVWGFMERCWGFRRIYV